MDIPPPTPVGGISPYLTPSDANAAADFYIKAFGAEQLARMAAQDGKRLMHCQLRINGAFLMLSDGFPEHGHPALPPQAVVLHLQVDDIDAWWSRATGAGAEVVMPIELMFWGDRYGQLKDPFGFVWSLGQTPKA